MKQLDGKGIKDFLSQHGVDFKAYAWGSGGEKLIFDSPFDSSHNGTSFAVIIHPDGGIGVEDKHDSGQNITIADLIRYYEPDFYRDDDFDFTLPSKRSSHAEPALSAKLTESQIINGILNEKRFLSYDRKPYRLDGKVYVMDPCGKHVKQEILSRLSEAEKNSRKQDQCYKLLLNDPRYEITEDQLSSYQIKGINFFEKEEGLVCARDVTIEKPEFLYHPYFPKGKLILVGAYPGAGKTMLMCYFAAKVTRGQSFFGCWTSVPHRVLYFSNEDGVTDTLKPRFDQAHGDVERLSFFHDHISFDEVSRIRNMIDQTDADIVIFDPLQSYASTAELNSAVMVRQMLDKLERISIDKNVTIIIVCHFNKNSKGDAITRIIGSTDIVGKCRSFIAVGNVPGSEDRKFFSHEKSNLARQGLTQIFKIDPDNGLIIPDGTSTKRYDDFYRKKPALHDDKLETAKKLILDNLNDEGCILAKDAYQLGENEDISKSTMKTARTDLGMYVPSKKGFQGKTVWKMPESVTSEDMDDINKLP